MYVSVWDWGLWLKGRKEKSHARTGKKSEAFVTRNAQATKGILENMGFGRF